MWEQRKSPLGKDALLSYVYHVSVSSDESMIAIAVKTGVVLFDKTTESETKLLSPCTNHATSFAAFAPHDESLITQGDRVRTWDLESGKITNEFRIPNGEIVAAVSISKNRKLVGIGVNNGSRRPSFVHVFSSGVRISDTQFHADEILDLTFSPVDNQVLATAGLDGTVKLWRLKTEDAIAQ